MSKHPTRTLAALIVAAVLVGFGPASAPGQTPADPPRLEAVVQQIEAIPGREDLSEAAKEELRQILQQTADALRAAQAFDAQGAEFDRLAAEAPATLERLRAEVAQPIPPPTADLPPDAVLQDAEQRLAEAQAELTAAREEHARLEAEPDRRTARRSELAQLVVQARQRLAELDERLSVTAPGEEEVDRARYGLLLALRRGALAEIALYDKERASYDARREVLPERRTRASRRVAHAEATVAVWQAEVQDRRRRQAEEHAREAQRLLREAAALTPALRDLAEQNRELAEDRSAPDGIASSIALAREELSRRPLELEGLRRDFASVRRKVDAAGLTSVVGQLLRRQLERLPDEAGLRQASRELRAAVAESQLELLQVEEMQAELRDEERFVRELLDGISPPPEAEEERAIRELAHELLAQRRAVLRSLADDHELFVDRLAPELEVLNGQLLLASSQFRSYIERRILWLRSVRGGAVPDPASSAQAAAWLVASPEWPEGVRRAWKHARANTIPAGLGAVILLALAGAAPWAGRRLSRIADRTRRFTTDSYRLTLAALGLTVVRAAPIPAAMLLVGWWLGAPPEQVEVARAASPALSRTAYILLGLLMVWHGLRPSGLAEAHFRWPVATVQRLRRHLAWFMAVAGVTSLVVGTMSRQTVREDWNESLGRTAFIVGLVALTILVQRLLRPSGPIGVYFASMHHGGWMERLRWAWYPLLAGAPVALCVLSLAGYHYTAHELAVRLVDSILLLIFLTLVYAMLLRWLFVERRRLAIARARERRAAAQEQAESSADAPAITDERALDVPAIDAQTRQLIRAVVAVSVVVGLYAVWAGTLPALRVLDRVQVWPSVRLLDASYVDDVSALVSQVSPADPASPAAPAPGATAPAAPAFAPPGVPPLAPPAAGAEGSATEAVPASVTLADIGVALLLILLTAVAARNVPGLLEITLLKRLPMDAGARYAASTVVRYIVLIVGVTAVFSALGIGWSKVQWLAAALTFGLAFGLQEIFANFISGLIILAERPVRVGDVVTIGDVSGTVSRIRMRATTILDWDRKELIVPNKSFITDQIINWTLSDPTLRLTVSVGVAYGSDLALVERTLMAVAEAEENVLRDPPPSVVFQRFGDSTLDFDLRVFIPTIDKLIVTRHRLQLAIDAAFREAGVEIAFPQRDLHIRSVHGEFTVKRDGSIERNGDA